MKIKKENTNRLKESILLLSFLFLLFSFSNKSFSKPTEDHKQKFTIGTSLISTEATLSGNNFTPDLKKAADNELSLLVYTHQLSAESINRNSSYILNLVIKKNSRIKSVNHSRFYYRLFSLRSEEFPA